MEIPVFTLDAFTNLAFKGNPAAVCPLMHELKDDLYLKIAAEMNLSETAFITRINPSDTFTTGSRFRLRWFTPITEVNLCGHATLASAAVLFQFQKNVNPTVVFETRSGNLAVTQERDRYVMDFPLNPPTHEDPNDFRDIVKVAVGDHPVQDVFLNSDTKKLMIRLSDSCDSSWLCKHLLYTSNSDPMWEGPLHPNRASQEFKHTLKLLFYTSKISKLSLCRMCIGSRSVLTSLKVDPFALMNSETSGRVKGLILTMKGSPDCQPGYDFYSRYFAPWAGIPEDPVTGSSHTVLGSYWSQKLGKKKMLAYQCSSRGGELELEVRDDGRINIAGEVTSVMQGVIRL